MIEIESVNFTKDEVVDVLSKYLEIPAPKVHAVIALLEKLGVISSYVFKTEPKVVVK